MAKWNWQQELARKDAEIERLRAALVSWADTLAQAGLEQTAKRMRDEAAK